MVDAISLIYGFAWIASILSVVLIAALRIDFYSTWTMFFNDSCMPVWLSCARKERRFREGCVMRTFRTLNWVSSAAFLLSSVSFMALLRSHRGGSQQVAAVVMHHPFVALVMTLSLLYLLLFFGVSVLLGTSLDQKQAGVARISPGKHHSAAPTESSCSKASGASPQTLKRRTSSPDIKEQSDMKLPSVPSARLSQAPSPKSLCVRAFHLLDWVAVAAVATSAVTTPMMFAYVLVTALWSGQATLETATEHMPEWAHPLLPAPATLPWLVACALALVLLLRESSARKALQARVNEFATNNMGAFSASSSVSTSAIAGTNLMVEMQAEQERLQSYVAEYPTGWYKLCDASELSKGDVKYVRCLGLHLAVFRGHDSGAASALDAFCPHLGANLALGGKVEGDCLKCPFHEWQFNTSGEVTKIPYTSGALPKAGAVRYPTTEYAGMVLVYYDADEIKYNDLSKKSGRNACADGAYTPKYLPPDMPELENGGMTLRGSFKARVVNMPLIEFVLNAVDQAHFACLHSEMMIPWTPWVIPPPFNLITIDHESGWHCGADVGEAGHLSHFTDKAYLKWLGKRLPYAWAQAVVDTTIIGPGGLVRFEFSIPDLGKIVLFETHTPLAHMKLRTEFRYFAEPAVPDLLVAYVVGNWYSQWHQDVSDHACEICLRVCIVCAASQLTIWENKRYLEKPLLVKGDGPFMKLRRWYKQFYPKSQPAIKLGEQEHGDSAAPAAAAAPAAPVAAGDLF